jgi:hypothetical protein
MYREARSVTQWLRHGWWIIPAYIVGFFAMLAFWKWHPDAPVQRRVQPVGVVTPAVPINESRP